MTKAAQRAVDSIAADVLGKTWVLGSERADALDAIALVLKERASDLRAKKIAAAMDEAKFKS